MMRHGFTFVEALVASALAALLLGAVWAVLGASTRQGRHADVRLQGVRAGLTFIQRFEHDFSRLCLDDRHDIVLDPDGVPGIAFHVFDDAAHTTGGSARTIEIAYTFDVARHAIYRREGSGRPRRIKGSYETLLFRRHGFHDYFKPPTSPPSPGGLLTFLVTGAPAEVLERPADQRKPTERTTFWCSLPLRAANGRRMYSFWHPNVFVPVGS